VEVERIDVAAERARLAAAIEDPADQLDDRRVQAGEVRRARQVLGPVDVLGADQADEVRVGVVVVEGQLGQSADRRQRVQVLDVDRLLGEPGSPRRRARAPRSIAAPCRRSSSRSSAWSCACVRRSDPPGARVAQFGELAGGHVEDVRSRLLGVAPAGRLRLSGAALPRPATGSSTYRDVRCPRHRADSRRVSGLHVADRN